MDYHSAKVYCKKHGGSLPVASDALKVAAFKEVNNVNVGGTWILQSTTTHFNHQKCPLLESFESYGTCTNVTSIVVGRKCSRLAHFVCV